MMDPLFDLTGKIALVTGGSRGLGYQMVKAFAERGADVIIVSRKLENCEKVADECRALGRRPGRCRRTSVAGRNAISWSRTLTPRPAASTSWSTTPG
jgi:NAD(P)-dependent dehydrogenase (short-subunit alcohol dehydrogenase family)